MPHRQVILVLLMLCWVAPHAAAGPNGSIEIALRENGVTDYCACEGSALFFPFSVGRIELQVFARLSGSSAEGIAGAEFYLEGLRNLPPTWACSVTEEPGSTLVGDVCTLHDADNDTVVDTRRATLEFAVTGPLPEDGCRVGEEAVQDLVLLVVSAGAPTMNLRADSRVRVVMGNPSSNPEFQCPVVTLCDSPIFTKICVTGDEFWINPTFEGCGADASGAHGDSDGGAVIQDCPTTAVAPETWSRVKEMYR